MKKYVFVVLAMLSLTAQAQDVETPVTLINDTIEEAGITSIHFENEENIILTWGTDADSDSLLFVSTVNKNGERLWHSTLLETSAIPSAVIYKKDSIHYISFATQTQGANSLVHVFSVSPDSQSTKFTFELDDQYAMQSIQRVNRQSYILASNTSQNQMALFRFSQNDSLLSYQEINVENDNEHYAISMHRNDLSDTDGFHIFGNTTNRFCMAGTDLSGNVDWIRYYSNDSILQASSSVRFKDDYVITGNNIGFGENNSHIFLMQLDNLGNTEWWETIGEENEETKSWDIVNDDNHGFFVAGSKQNSEGNYSSFLVRTDTLGITNDTSYWQIDMDAEENRITSMVSSGDDDYVLLGSKIINNHQQVLYGYFGYSVTGILLPSITDISVYPNPAQHYIHFTGLSGIQKAEIYSVAGELKKIINLNNSNAHHEIQIQDLNPGTYIMILSCQNKYYRAKFLKQ